MAGQVLGTEAEQTRRDAVVERLLHHIRDDLPIRLPAFGGSSGSAEFALLQIAKEEGPFSGALAEYRYIFEGEDDLLHLFVVRADGAELNPEEAREVLSFVLPQLPPGVAWLKPGKLSQHFYFGHDELLR